jgi:hypothetical protein
MKLMTKTGREIRKHTIKEGKHPEMKEIKSN